MSIALAPAVTDAHATGEWADAYLIRFDLPGKTVGYVAGPRPLTFNGLTYLPNRYLSKLQGSSTLGSGTSQETVKFSNVPTDNVEDALASVYGLDYQNAPVLVSTLVLDPTTGEPTDIGESAIYEVADAPYQISPRAEDGSRELTLSVVLEPPQRAVREQSGVKSSLEEQQFDNDPTDYGHRYSSTVGEWETRWGMI